MRRWRRRQRRGRAQRLGRDLDVIARVTLTAAKSEEAREENQCKRERFESQERSKANNYARALAR